MNKNLVIIGNNPFAEIADEYFTYDSPYNVVGFSVERNYIKSAGFLGRRIVPFDEIENYFPPSYHSIFVTLGYDKMNRDRTRLYLKLKEKGYGIASYISSSAFVWRNAKIGEHCFVFESNTIQPFVKIGNNVVMWSGNHIGHHTNIGNNCFISSHVVISGLCNIGENCFFGVNSTVVDNINIGAYCFIGAVSNVVKNTIPSKIYIGNPARIIKKVTI